MVSSECHSCIGNHYKIKVRKKEKLVVDQIQTKKKYENDSVDIHDRNRYYKIQSN